MKAWRTFFHAPYAESRAYLLFRGALVLLALDVFRLMIGHAGRYGIDGFNVAHFAWLDRIEPVPPPALYIAVLLLTGLLALVIAVLELGSIARIALLLLYTFSWSMSMLDSYQHHYFLSLVLLCLVFFPRSQASAAASQNADTTGFGYPLLGASIAIVYAFTALAKVDPQWMAGDTLLSISNAEQALQPAADVLTALGVPKHRVWGWVATAVIPQEAALSVCYLVATLQDRSARRWPKVISSCGFALAAVLHLGAEALELRIGWFSWYMLLLACCYLLPRVALDRIAALVRAAAGRVGRLAQSLPGRRRVSGTLGMLVLTLLAIAACAHDLGLPGAAATGVITGAILVGVTARAQLRSISPDPYAWHFAVLGATAVMWIAVTTSSARWDFYRYLGGDLKRRGQLEAALDAYLRGEAYAPEGESRSTQIAELRRALKKRERRAVPNRPTSAGLP